MTLITENCNVKIDNTTTVSTKWEGMLCTHAVQRVQHAYIFMHMTAANEVENLLHSIKSLMVLLEIC